ncbi:S41 family peptidase [Candidatus Uhrbacteria bacterium]|nr:S41 family peptidase [Candidatus Uhrbacteria bacterium]
MTQGFFHRRLIRGGLTVLIAIALFGTGWLVGIGSGGAGNPSSNPVVRALETGRSIDLQQFWNVWDLVKSRSIKKPVDDSALLYGAMKGVVSSLKDPYSVLLDPQESKRFTQDLSGSFEGIGAEIGIRKNQLVIIAPLPGTPAEKAGIKAGDAIVAIDGVDTGTLTLEEAVSKIRGPKGSIVKLLIFRSSFTKPKEMLITRSRIEIKSVSWQWATEKQLPPELKRKKIAVVKLSSFDEHVVEEFSQAVQQMTVGGVQGLIVDVRNNPGGLLDAAVSIAGEWIDRNLVVIESHGIEGNSPRTEYRSSTAARLSTIPTVMLVNQGSASAAEILAGALEDYGKAILVGTKTFGKGSVQELIPLSDGSSLKLTIARWLTPHGRSINENGIEPTIKVELPEDGKTDVQLERAFQEMVRRVK